MRQSLCIWIALLLSISPFTAIAEVNDVSHINVLIKYTSMFPGKIQVRDKVCSESANIECEKARIKVESKSCQHDGSLSECQEAGSLLESKFCIKGLIYDGRINKDDQLTVTLCKSYAGFGNASIRNTINGETWTNYSLITEGDTITYP